MPNVIGHLGRLITVRCIVAVPLILSYLLAAVLHLTPQANSVSLPRTASAKKSCACRCAGGCGGECCCSSSATNNDEENQPANGNAGGLVLKSPECSGTQSLWLVLSAQIMPIPSAPFCLDVKITALVAPTPTNWLSLAVSPRVPPPRSG
jgi:hypothetical protein